MFSFPVLDEGMMSRRDSSGSLCAVDGPAGKANSWMCSCYMLNDVKHIQDYYAPVVGEFEQLVLMALVRVGNGGYGASIRREIQERTGRDVSVGAVYVTLKRLETKKMVCSYTGSPTPRRGGRRRTHYVIDAAGERALGRAYRTFVAMADGVQQQLAKL